MTVDTDTLVYGIKTSISRNIGNGVTRSELIQVHNYYLGRL